MILVVASAGGSRELRLERGLLTIGRDAECDVVLQEAQASRRHAELRRLGDQWFLVDLGSTNGTLIGDRQLPPHQAWPLEPGQVAVIGDTRLSLRAEPEWQPEAVYEEEVLEAPAEAGPSIRLEAVAWLSRIAAGAAAVLLFMGSMSDWVRIRAQLPIVGEVFDRTFDGMDSGYGWLLVLAALVSLLLVLLDVLVRRAGLAAGLGQLLIAAFTAAALAVTGYSYYQTGSQSVFGISLLDVFTKYARNVVQLTIQPGIYLVAAGLGGLLLAGLLRLVAASMASRQ